ncbi:hypothetical protein C8Q80DRAFT_1140665 [Daedaleopsis nitida]|nr:hypothetical protein C8Q80DRAFT_1140665 [Daedaleopsis nitida]
MDEATPRPSTSSDTDSFESGRASPIHGFDSSAALILVPDSEDGPSSSAAFDFSSEDDDTEDESDVQLERLRNSAIPPLSSFSVFLYLLSPYTKLGALVLPSAGLPLKVGVPTLVLFAMLSAFTRQIWYMLARYVRRADLEEIVLETFARGRGKEGRRAALRQLVRLFVGLLRVSVATLYLRFSVDILLPYFPDVLSIPSRVIATVILAAFIAPIYAARSLASRRVVYASWVSVAAYAAWFACTTYMHANRILVPVSEPTSLGKLWHGVPAIAFTFSTSSSVSLYASLKGTVDRVSPKPRRSHSFKLLSILSVAVAVSLTLPLVFFEASPKPPQSPSPSLQMTSAALGAASLLLSAPAIIITTPALPVPYSARRAVSFPLSKVLVYLLPICLSLLPRHVFSVGSDIVVILTFLSTYVVPAFIHITIHNFRRPLSIVIPPATPTVSRPIAPSDSRNDELLQRKERTLQRRRLGRRLIWDIGVWVLLLPIGCGGLVWAVGRELGKW